VKQLTWAKGVDASGRPMTTDLLPNADGTATYQLRLTPIEKTADPSASLGMTNRRGWL